MRGMIDEPKLLEDDANKTNMFRQKTNPIRHQMGLSSCLCEREAGPPTSDDACLFHLRSWHLL